MRDSADFFFASAAMSSALHAAALRTWNGLNEVFHDLLCPMWCNEMCYVTAAPVTVLGFTKNRTKIELEIELD